MRGLSVKAAFSERRGLPLAAALLGDVLGEEEPPLPPPGTPFRLALTATALAPPRLVARNGCADSSGSGYSDANVDGVDEGDTSSGWNLVGSVEEEDKEDSEVANASSCGVLLPLFMSAGEAGSGDGEVHREVRRASSSRGGGEVVR